MRIISPLTAVVPAAAVTLTTLAGGQATIFVNEGAVIGDQYGFDVDFVGDVDGDGVEDWITGSPAADANGNASGKAIVYSGVSGDVLHEFEGQAVFDQMGQEVAGAGDVNKDGTPDFLVFSRLDSTRGRVNVFSGDDGSTLYTLSGAEPFALFGESLAGLGDVDGDDYDDFFIGAPGQGGTVGEIYVYSGRTGSVHWSKTGTGTLWLGFDADSVGDVDGDGYSDVIVGSHLDAGSDGRATVYSGATGAELYTFTGGMNDGLGRSVAGIGDINDDDVPDFAIGLGFGGSPQDLPSARAYSGADGSVLHQWNSVGAFNAFAKAIEGVGDVNADGVPDVAVSQPEANVAEKVWIFSGANGDQLLAIEGDKGVGYSLAGHRDVNGDGLADLLIGDPLDGIHGIDAGFVYGVTPGCPAGASESYCTSAPNSAGSGALMGFQNSLSIAANDLRLLATGCPEDQFGVFFYGASPTEVVFGDGFRCVDSPIFRLPVVSTGGGTASHLVDYKGPPQATGEIAAFSAWYFQFWYRDPNGAGGGFNLTDGMRLSFCP